MLAPDKGFELVSRHRGSRHNSRAGIPPGVVAPPSPYSRYAQSSRRASRGPRSGTYAAIHGGGTPAQRDRRAGSRQQPLAELAERLATVADGGFSLAVHLGQRYAVGGIEEDGS